MNDDDLEIWGGGPPTGPTGCTDAVPHDRFDEQAWNFALDEVRSLRDLTTELGKEHDFVSDFMQDMFNLYMKGDPQVRPAQEMAPSHVPNRALAHAFRGYPEWTNLHQHTIGDLYGATMAVLSQESEIRQALDAMQAARDLAEQLEAAMEGGADEQALADLGNQLEEVAEGKARAAVGAMRVAARRHTEDAENERALMSAFGVEDGDLQTMSFAERRELARKLAGNRLAKFAKLIGAFRAMARAEVRRRVDHVPSEIVGVQLGSELHRLTSAEMESLAIPELEDDFWLRYVEGRLLNYRLAGNERQGHGPLIIVCDESESMNTADLNSATREAWAKGFALALADAARRDKREVTYIGFSSSSQQWRIDLSHGKAGVAEMIRFTEHFFCGGTHYERPLKQALDLAAAATLRPDIVFITDDEYRQPKPEFIAEWQRVRQELSMRCYGVTIGNARSGAMHLLADDVRTINSFVNDPTVVADIFRSM